MYLVRLMKLFEFMYVARRLIFVLLFADGQYIATVSHDRTIKLWSGGSEEEDLKMDVDED